MSSLLPITGVDSAGGLRDRGNACHGPWRTQEKGWAKCLAINSRAVVGRMKSRQEGESTTVMDEDVHICCLMNFNLGN